MLPYPSGEPHIGHLKVYSVGDAVAHFHRRTGRRVLQPMGYDAFGLPAENHAIKTGQHPRDSTIAAIAEFQRQFREWGISIDWSREFATCDPEYYRWTQWIFLELLKHGLAYRKDAIVKWCPNDQTVLANEQVIDGHCERCGFEVEVKQLNQWFFRITDYADRLLDDLATIEWPEHVKTMQRNWIGRSHGAEVTFRCEDLDPAHPIDYPVFTTRPDTLFGATFFVMAPEHPDVERLAAGTGREAEVHEYVNRVLTESNELRGKDGQGEDRRLPRPPRRQPGQRRGDPHLRRRLRADGVRHRRDHGGARARRARLRVRQALRSADPARHRGREPGRRRRAGCRTPATARSSTRRPSSTACRNREALEAIVAWLDRDGQGPLVGELPPARLADLAPALLGLPDPRRVLRRAAASSRCPRTSCPSCCRTSRTTRRRGSRRWPPPTDWVNTTCPSCGGPARRETDTMDTFVDSSWYFLRYCDAHNDEAAWDPAVVREWMPVDQYIGGVEHAILHLHVRALLQQGARGPRASRRAGAVRPPVHAGHDHQGRGEDVQVQGQRRPARRDRRHRTAPTPPAPTSSSSARPTRTPTGRTRASRASTASSAGSGA